MIGFIIFVFLILRLYKYKQQLSFDLFHFNFLLFGLSLVLLISCYMGMGLLWARILRVFHPDLQLKQGLLIYLLSQFAKYVPGGIWNYVGRVYLCYKWDIPYSLSSYSLVLEVIFVVFSGALLSLISYGLIPIPISIGKYLRPQYLLLAILLIILIYRYRNAIMKCLPERIRKSIQSLVRYKLKPSMFIRLTVLYFFNWILLVLAFYVFIKSLYFVKWGILPVLSVVYPVSWIAGFLSPTPGGIGVREGFLAYFLGMYLPQKEALAFSLASRIWMILAEVISYPMALVLLKERRKDENSGTGNNIS